MQYVVPVCVRTRTGRQIIPKIDTGIAQKGHLWMETRLTYLFYCREIKKE